MKTTNLVLIGLGVLVTGCGTSYHAPAEVQPYVNSFITDAQQNGFPNLNVNDVDIEFVSDPSALGGQDAVGECEITQEPLGFDKHIYLLQSYWDSVDSNYREILVYHELGHCVLSRVHTTATIDFGQGQGYSDVENASIMFPDINNMEVPYMMHRAYYVNELFANFGK